MTTPLRGPVTALLVRLLPSPTTDGGTFTNYLSNLTITAYDRMVSNDGSATANGASEVKLGSASGLAPLGGKLEFHQTPDPPTGPSVPVTTLTASIFQHFWLQKIEEGPVTILNPVANAVATAIIIVNIDASATPSPHPEYPGPTFYDVRLVVERNGIELPSPPIQYNVATVAIDQLSPQRDPTLQSSYMETYLDSHLATVDSLPVAMYYILPAPPKPNTPKGALLNLDPNGQPPNFDDLVTAVNKVLAMDHPAGFTLLKNQSQPLTLAQCAQIASEIVYDPATNPPPVPIPRYPPPAPPKNSPPGRQAPIIDDLYTTTDSDMENLRRTFEGSLTSYHSTNDATAQRLAAFIYAASLAVDSERRTSTEKSASMTFPIDPSIATSNPTVSVVLQGWDNSLPTPLEAPKGPALYPLNPSYIVPAAYFYALGTTFPTQLTPEQRYTAIITSTEASLASQLKAAINSGTLKTNESPRTVANPTPINAAQAVRRLTALSASVMTSSDPQIYLTGSVASLVTSWLSNKTSETDPTDLKAFTTQFWGSQYQSSNYLDLVLQIVTAGSVPLINAIKAAPLVPSTTNPPGAPKQVTTAATLSQVPVAAWQSFFSIAENSKYLPPYTLPGSVAQQIQAFISYLRKLFSVGFSSTAAPTTSVGSVPSFEGKIVGDVVQFFISNYTGTFSFSVDPNDSNVSSSISAALSVSFPNDEKTQKWVRSAIGIIHTLVKITTFETPVDKKMQFSYMEALYARGFTSLQSVVNLTKSQFQAALTGTVAFEDASRIYALAGSPPEDGDTTSTGFAPCNPGGLVNCLPTPQNSPLGPVAYLHELLQMKSGDHVLGDAVSARRGTIGKLLASKSNLETLVPRVDLVLESLESLGSNLSSTTVGMGAIYDTADTNLGDFEIGQGKTKYDADELLEVIPEHSTPAVPVAAPGLYTTLESCFTAPTLPYSQSLDICRSYCCVLGTSRFEVLRTFRKDITELALDAVNEPSTFQRQQWRLPVRLDTALEYLQISKAEYTTLFSGQITIDTLLQFYGIQDREERSVLLTVPAFQRAVGLTSCEFLELWRCKFVPFSRKNNELGFPDCLPCCATELEISFSSDNIFAPLAKLMVFIRLWKKLQLRCQEKISFDLLANICNVLGLFVPSADQVEVNPEFIRQLIALLMLRDQFRLPWTEKPSKSVETPSSGHERTQLLELWGGSKPGPKAFEWPVKVMLSGIQHYAREAYGDCQRGPESAKIIADNLEILSRLAGFTSSFPWWSKPTCTLRFAQVLAKIWASNFTIGELLFLFTIEPHLDGDDPFPLPTISDSIDHPFELPESIPHNLEALRKKLLSVEVAESDLKNWTWYRAESIIRRMELRPAESAKTVPDSLLYLAEHFFPGQLEKEGHPVTKEKRRFSTQLSSKASSSHLWNSTPCEPFHYTAKPGSDGIGELWFQLPLRDEEVFRKLEHSRQLQTAEADAVRDLYYAPRAALAPFALIFLNFSHAINVLIQEPNEESRFKYFCREVSMFERRCEIISQHLARHVDIATGCDESTDPCPTEEAFNVLKSLIADENRATSLWEDDSGVRPSKYSWDPVLSGNAFAALLGLCGSGLLGKFKASVPVEWPELTGDMTEFGAEHNRFNVPALGVIPRLDVMPTPDQEDLVTFKNGFALRDEDGKQLRGAEPFKATWTGVLYVAQEGHYEFSAVASGDLFEKGDDGCHPSRWLVSIKRGQKTWIVSEQLWTDESKRSVEGRPICLQKGAYDILVEFAQVEPVYDHQDGLREARTGFELKYKGPDTNQRLEVIELRSLYQQEKTKPLGTPAAPTNSVSLPFHVQGNINDFLALHYYSTITDIRRTYQRAFKALLFVRRFGLSTHDIHCDHQSELGFMLSHPDRFAGRSYYQTGAGPAFQTHLANFDLNFLPVADPYHSPSASVDSRAGPSAQHQAAMFDWWERIFDYVQLRAYIQEVKKRPLWLLFEDVVSQNPSSADQLVRHLGINLNLAKMILNYYGSPEYVVTPGDLVDEIWSIRLWKANLWAVNLQRTFYTEIMDTAQPYSWASDDPGGSSLGNKNLTNFVRKSLLASKNAPRRATALKNLDDGLRERARKSLFAYLCDMNRVPLSFNVPGGFAALPRDLSDLLLQDVEVGITEKASRIEDAICSVQKFVQRARMGLEPSFAMTPEFSIAWNEKYKTIETWFVGKRREIYRENWIQWDELQEIMSMEGYKFLKAELERNVLAVPKPGRPMWWEERALPPHPHLDLTQTREMATLRQQQASTSEGIALMANPLRDARPSLLALDLGGSATASESDANVPSESHGTDPPTHLTIRSTHADALDSSGLSTLDVIPSWVQAAIRLGVQFVRVAAAGTPLTLMYHSQPSEKTCNCIDCQSQQNDVVDEYYFWLHDSQYFNSDDAPQDAAVGTQSNTDPTTWWTDSTHLPGLLNWKPRQTYYLLWTRVRQGRLDPPRRSAESVPIDPPPNDSSNTITPFLTFLGRDNDSLLFSVIPTSSSSDSGASATTPATIKPSGFRYDLSTDAAVVTPQIATNPSSTQTPPSGLAAYPRFIYFEPGKPLVPTSSYGPSVTIARALRSNCQFEDALRWCRNVLDPLLKDNTWAQCPKQILERLTETGTLTARVGTDAGNATHQPNRTISDHEDAPLLRARDLHREFDPVHARERDGLSGRDLPCCPSYPVNVQVARSRAVLLEYLDILLEWAQQLLGRNNSQSIEQAMVILDNTDRILGPQPETINAHDSAETRKMSVGNFIPSPGPLNPRLLEMYDLTKELRELGKNSLTLRRRFPDPVTLGLARRNANLRPRGLEQPSICIEEVGCFTRRQPYRFTSLLPKALDWTSMVKSLGSSLLSAYEKGDNELLSVLRSTHDRQILEIGLDVAKNQWRAADWDVQVLEETMLSALTKLRYYNGLISGGLNSGEVSYLTNAESSMQNKSGANATETEAQAMNLIPDLAFGIAGLGPYQSTQIPIGTKLSQGLTAAAQVMNRIAEIASTNGSLAQTQGSWQRRAQDWQNQVDLITVEIQQVKRQQAAAWRRRDIALRQLTSHTQQMEHSAEVQDFMRDKFTKHELYLFLQQETARLYRKAFNLAMQTAYQTQEAFWYERGDNFRDFLPETAWESLHEGLMAGEKLELALHTMGREYMNLNCREYELTKHVSARQVNNGAPFLQLKTRGYCELDLPEWMFDLDYPGHYMRRLKSVTVSVACVSGPYTGVHCRLQLLSSAIRVYPFLPSKAASCCDGKAKAWTDTELDDPDPYLLWRHTGTEAIATSTGADDAGLFSLSFNDERYLPFEFSGAISRWRIELPQENNQFALSSITDFILHLNYTAREGGHELRRHANERAQALLPKTGVRFLDIRHEFPDAWRVFSMKDELCNGPSPSKYRELPLHFSRAMFPYLTGRDTVRLTSLQVFFELRDPHPGVCRSDHIQAQYVVPREHRPSCPNHHAHAHGMENSQHGQYNGHFSNNNHNHQPQHTTHSHRNNNANNHPHHNPPHPGNRHICDCDLKLDIPCVQDGCCASLYHGSIADMNLEPVRELGYGFRDDHERTRSFIRFPERLPAIKEGYLLVGYDAAEEESGCDCCAPSLGREERKMVL